MFKPLQEVAVKEGTEVDVHIRHGRKNRRQSHPLLTELEAFGLWKNRTDFKDVWITSIAATAGNSRSVYLVRTILDYLVENLSRFLSRRTLQSTGRVRFAFDRQDSQTRPHFIDGNDRTGLDLFRMLLQNLNYICPDCLGHDILATNLYDTRAILPTGSQKCGETQVVREDNMIGSTRP